MDYFGVSLQSAKERKDVVVFDGVMEDGTPNTIEVPLADPETGVGSYYRARYGFGFSEMNVFDASWGRLRTVGLHYDLAPLFENRISISKLILSFFAHNLWLKTDYPGIDPETNLTGSSNGYGLDYFNMPSTKSYGVSVKLGL
jgi:hypothetical protein